MTGIATSAIGKNTYEIEFIRNGEVFDKDIVENLIPNEGLDNILDKYYLGSAYTAAHYMGLKSVGTEQAADTMLSHPNWTEITTYNEAARPQMLFDAVANQAISNSTNRCVFTLNADATIYGAFVSTDSTKGGTAGILCGVGDFVAGSRVLRNGDIIRITGTFSQASA